RQIDRVGREAVGRQQVRDILLGLVDRERLVVVGRGYIAIVQRRGLERPYGERLHLRTRRDWSDRWRCGGGRFGRRSRCFGLRRAGGDRRSDENGEAGGAK